MVDQEQLTRDLGLERFSPDRQQAIYEDFTYELGAAISDGLSEGQMAEFTSIINGDQTVIDAWLSAHAPGCRDDPSYHELERGYAEDPEKVPAGKVYASIGWVRLNRPDFEQIVAAVTREFRVQLDAELGNG